MNNLSNIKNIPEVEFPKGLHGRIMRRLFFLRFRTNFLLITLLLGFNIVISGWHFLIRLGDLDTISVLDAAMDGFNLSREFVSSLFGTLIEFFPLAWASVLLINILSIIYIGYLYSRFKTFPTLKVD